MRTPDPPWILIDVNNLAHKAYHTTGHLRNDIGPTGVLYGLLRDIKFLGEYFNSDKFVFCFDMGKTHREIKYSFYKETRRNKYLKMSEEEKNSIAGMREQVDDLRIRHLKRLGYRNIFFQRGFEADDIIASVSNGLEEKGVIVTGDHDLYQCVRPNVSVYHPSKKEIVGWDSVIKKYGVKPTQWAKVKAIAGCSTDDVPGVKGIGEILAIQYIRGELKGVRRDRILEYVGSKEYRIGKELVTLPWPGCNDWSQFLQPNYPSEKEWSELVEELGFGSLEINTARVPLRKK